jgi:ABC-type multidrug transport system permease subunit
MNKLYRTWRHFVVLLKKNFKSLIRDRALLRLTLLSPVLIVAIFSFTLQFNQDQNVYDVGFYNQDKIGILSPGEDFAARASLDFIWVASELRQTEAKDASPVFNVYEYFNRQKITEDVGRELCDNNELDAFVNIPDDFSESIIGSSWWYQSLVAHNFTNIDDVLNQTGMEIYRDQALSYMNATRLPNKVPEITIYVNPDIVARTLISSILGQILNDLMLVYNALDLANITIINRNDIGNELLSYMDTFMPAYIMISALFPSVAMGLQIVEENQKKTMEFVDSTHANPIIHLLSMQTAQTGIAAVQAGLVLLTVYLSGTFIHPAANLWLEFANLLLLSFVSIGIGTIIGLVSNTPNEASQRSVLLLLTFQLLGDLFFTVDYRISRWVPIYYANITSRFILLDGKGWDFINGYLGIMMWFGVAFYLIGYIAFYVRRKRFQQM